MAEPELELLVHQDRLEADPDDERASCACDRDCAAVIDAAPVVFSRTNRSGTTILYSSNVWTARLPKGTTGFLSYDPARPAGCRYQLTQLPYRGAAGLLLKGWHGWPYASACAYGVCRLATEPPGLWLEAVEAPTVGAVETKEIP